MPQSPHATSVGSAPETAAVVIVDGPLGPENASREVDNAGALLCFEGVVRPLEGGRVITALDYEAYQPMAETQLRRLAEEMVRRHGLLAVRVEHSRGRVAAGECSFRLRIASRHRPEALRATEEFIDQMKRDVPIWKTPVFAE